VLSSLALAWSSFAAAAPGATALYAEHCADCHGATLRGSAHGTALVGAAFVERWRASGSRALLDYNASNMPPGDAGRLAPREHRQLADYLLEANGLDPLVEAPGATEALDSWSDAGSIDLIARTRSGFRNRSLETFRPVTDAMLADPPPGDWLSWRRSLDGHGFSPMDEVDRSNVHRLQLAWALAMREGSNQGTPLVHDGTIFLTHPDNVVQAVDGATGDVIWEYAYNFPEAARTLGGPTRNIAIYGDKLFLATYDAALVAIDARTGTELWRTVKADYRKGYTHTAGPIVGKGVVLSGLNGCERFQSDGCFVSGHDPDTGKELWRTSTIALPGTAGDSTWGDVEPEFRAGGDTWIAGSYDPTLQLFFIRSGEALGCG
jgi:alcohol dehydrogenase (cytochrome c)